MARPIISKDEIKKIVSDHYGLKVTELRELLGYDDKNFLVKVDNDIIKNKNVNMVSEKGYVFKVVNLMDSENDEMFAGQTAVLLELEKHNIAIPKPILTVDSKPFTKVTLKSGNHIVRLLKFIEGTTLYKVGKLTGDMCFEVGQLAGQINIALENFNHPAYEKPNNILWSIASVSSHLRKYVHAVTDQSKKYLCQQIISEFTERVTSNIDSLKTGIIHGDINEHNLLLEEDFSSKNWRLKAIIDFGDTNRGCYLFELAIAMLYMILISDNNDKIDNGGHVLAGYLTVKHLPEEELDLLPICIKARLVQSLVMGAYANSQDPNNTYVLSTAVKGWTVLTELEKISEQDLQTRWKKIVADRCQKNGF